MKHTEIKKIYVWLNDNITVYNNGKGLINVRIITHKISKNL